jgi:hypothetical protein
VQEDREKYREAMVKELYHDKRFTSHLTCQDIPPIVSDSPSEPHEYRFLLIIKLALGSKPPLTDMHFDVRVSIHSIYTSDTYYSFTGARNVLTY